MGRAREELSVSAHASHESLVTRLKRLDAPSLERAAQRLTHADLLTLARFQAQPHVLIHHAVSALQIVLLSISLQHQKPQGLLQVLPWSLLRLELLTHVDTIWHKMWRRLGKLKRSDRDPQRKQLASAQVRFVLQYILSPSIDNDDPLCAFSRISSIAESIAAFTLLCALYTLAPPLSSSPTKVAAALVHPSSPTKSIVVPPLASADSSSEWCSDHSTSWRCGFKHNGRFFLFHATLIGPNKLSTWSVLAIDRYHAAAEGHRIVDAAAPSDRGQLEHCIDQNHVHAWRKHGPIPPGALAIMREASHNGAHQAGCIATILVQSATQWGLFRPPALDTHSPAFSVTASTLVIPTFTLFLAVVSLDGSIGLQLSSVGHALLCDPQTTRIADIRRHVLATRNRGGDTTGAFQFIASGSLIPLAEEPWRKATELLPFGVLVSLDSECSSKRWTPLLPTISRFHDEASQRLCCHLPTRWILDSACLAPCSSISLSMFPVSQPLASSLPSSLSCSSPSPPLCTVVDIFLNWSAFVCFQQLQNSVSIYRAASETHAAMPRPKPMTDYLLETEKLQPEPSPVELERMSLPHEPFCPEKEFFLPLYVNVSIESPTSAAIDASSCEVLAQVVHATRACRARLVVGHEECIIHVTDVPRAEQTTEARKGRYFTLHFQRDASCPVEILLTQRNAFVWAITSLKPSERGRKAPSARSPAIAPSSSPPRWLRDILRFVSHPTLDFTNTKTAPTPWPFPDRFFHVAVPHALIEKFVEATCWSRGVDWSPHWTGCDVESELLRPKFAALCASHPPSWSIDSIKLSKFLRECGVQPAVLTVGGAALLFTTHRAPGSHYEMIYEGFVDALRWIAQRVYSREDDNALRLLCFDWLVGAPSMFDCWHGVVNQWRLREKLHRMEVAAMQYCAATRIRANWKRLITRRKLVDTLARMKLDRRAAAKLQSMYKMRKQRKKYLALRGTVVRTQRFIKARRLLRQLRAERAGLIERMRRKLQKWMRQRLRVLRCWKVINEAWLARQARILEKRSRLVASGAFAFENRIVRASLYRAAPKIASEGTAFELELAEPSRSWFCSIPITSSLLERLEADVEAVTGLTKPVLACERGRWVLRVLVQRLHFKNTRRHTGGSTLPDPDPLVQFYRDPLDSSLGRLVFQGSVKDHVDKSTTSDVHFVRLLCRAHDFAMVIYSARTSTRQRVTFTSSFVHRVFQVSHWLGLTIPRDEGEETDTKSMQVRKVVIEALMHRPDRLLALRLLLEYLQVHGTKRATRDILPDEIARREAEEQARLAKTRWREEQRVLRLVIRSQANARRFLATRTIQSIASRSYLRCFDSAQKVLVYKLQRLHDVLTYTAKPRSLGSADAPLVRDEWILDSNTADPSKRFFNPLRGIFSRINDVQAATAVQRRFRRHMWACLGPWDLRRLSEALLFHHHVQAPKDLANPDEVAAITRYALQRHTVHHDFKHAALHYEAALVLDPENKFALVGLALLLIYTNKYPSKQSWARGLEFLNSARANDRDLAASLAPIEQNCFRWAVHLHPKSADALGNLAVYMQCVRGELDTAELLYRRAIDLDAANERVIENYVRLTQERSPEGLYSAAGPSKTSIWGAQEIQQVGNSSWRELEDIGARVPTARRFFRNIRTGECVWRLVDVSEVTTSQAVE